MLLSVIIPTFNRAAQLPICIDSVLGANLKDLEIIIVDDGSTDHTREVCQKITCRDKRVKYHYQNNSGVSVARNLGLSKASGRWIAFCDSDDAVMPEHFDIIAANLNVSNALLMTGSQIVELTDGVFSFPRTEHKETLLRESAVKFLFSNEFNPYRSGFFFIWNKFFLREVLIEKNLFFKEKMSLDEDMHFTLRYLAEINKIIYNKTPTYLTINWPGITHLGCKRRSPKEYIDVFKANFEEYCKLYSSTSIKDVKDFGVYYAIHRTIRLALIESEDSISLSLVKKDIIPFLSTIKISNYGNFDLITLMSH